MDCNEHMVGSFFRNSKTNHTGMMKATNRHHKIPQRYMAFPFLCISSQFCNRLGRVSFLNDTIFITALKTYKNLGRYVPRFAEQSLESPAMGNGTDWWRHSTFSEIFLPNEGNTQRWTEVQIIEFWKRTGTLIKTAEMVNTDKKETDKDTEFIKDEDKPTRKYIFQTSTITKVATIIVVVFLILLVIGLIASGTSLFDGPWWFWSQAFTLRLFVFRSSQCANHSL